MIYKYIRVYAALTVFYTRLYMSIVRLVLILALLASFSYIYCVCTTKGQGGVVLATSTGVVAAPTGSQASAVALSGVGVDPREPSESGVLRLGDLSSD